MITALILVESGFQDEELIYPYYRMQEAGWKVDVASPDGKERYGKYGVPAKVTHVIACCEVCDVLLIPGGFECPDRLRMRPDVQVFVHAMHGAGKLIAAICHGPWVLISADICKGYHMTGYESIRPDLVNAGAIVAPNEYVVADRNIITAQHYKHNGAFMLAVMRWQSDAWPKGESHAI